MKFTVHATADGSRARVATLETTHTVAETPVFMPVGTRGTVRTQSLAQLEQLDAPILLANTYHLMLRPGIEVFERFGGLRPWMGWRRGILTDSGGFQVFSLPETTIDEHGATMRGADQRLELLTPERSIAMQRAIGSDIMMVLDQCIASTSPHAAAEAAMQLTHRWAARSLAARGDSPNALFAIVQGACFADLRRTSADVLTELGARAPRGFDGYAVGGLAVGESRAEREDTTELVTEHLPLDRPRYLMGVGMPIDLLEGVHRGIDMFDCILPTALAQQGVAFTSRGRVDLARGVYKLAEATLDPDCDCDACTRVSRSYLHHLVKCQEPLGWRLIASHNLTFYTRFMARIRGHIRAGTFAAFRAEQRVVLLQNDLDHPPGPSPRVKPSKLATRGAFALHTSTKGHVSIQHVASNEIMHSINDPDVEAAQIYVDQSVLLARALSSTPTSATPLVVWDVGLGAGHNAMALLRAIERASGRSLDAPPETASPDAVRPRKPRSAVASSDAAEARRVAALFGAVPDRAAEPPTLLRPIQLISFELDLDALRLALDHVEHFPHLRHRAPHVLAQAGRVSYPQLDWTLCEGDFLSTFAAQPRPDVIFYDPFSAKVDGPLWTLATFRRLFAHVASDHAPPVELFTYTNSTAIRSTMLAAGFHVARGVASGPKTETTIALTQPLPPHSLLGRDWLDRRARSSAPRPADLSPDDHDAFERAIRDHVQFG